MTAATLRSAIAQSLAACAAGPLAEGARALLGALGYASDRTVEVGPDAAGFLADFNQAGRLDPARALTDQWRSVAMVFQLTGAEIAAGGQLSIFDSSGFEAQTYRSFLFFAVELAGRPDGRPYARGQLATITREINKLFTMPVSVLFRHGGLLSLAIVTHRPNLRDESRDVLEKVSLIRDVRPAQPHRAHVEILADLALASLAARQTIAGFGDLQRAWARTLDISELNRRFYREIANWYFWAVGQVTFPDDGAPPARRNADRVIRLITRLIFVWFLREKGLVDARLFQRAEVERLLGPLDDAESSYYKAILQNLFFATLNQEMGKRAFRRPGQNYGAFNLYRHEALFRDPQAALARFAQVPFLNGGLFECLDNFDQKPPLRIDAFSDRPDSQPTVPNALFFAEQPQQVDLNATYGTRGRRYEVRGIIEILERYKFTVAENTPVEEDVALDPELLGQVFENLLAAYNPETETTARKETGSFYTPRNVVAYMVDESLLLYLKDYLQKAAPLIVPSSPNLTPQPPLLQGEGESRSDGGEVFGADLDARLRELLAYSDQEPPFGAEERRHLVVALDTLTLIDPACGSGAFPMGALQKLVYLLGKLDPGNRGWKARQIARAERIEDSQAREAAIESIEEAFERNDLDYGRKLFLIENCIYGVDIQPIAVQIAKLRCFISLVVEQQVHDDRPNRGIRPLPNLETKFVAADAINSVVRPPQLSFRDPAIEEVERELDRVRSQHFSARTPATKRKYRERDQELRARLGALLLESGFSGDAAAALAAWDPYAQNRYAPFFDPEWMFGREEGFDIVIANPPYVRQEQIKERKAELAKRYTTYSGTADLYVYFYERAVQLLKPGGVLTFISSNKFFRAGYGEKLRAFLAAGTTIQQIIDFGDAPVFTAIAYPSIIIAQKGGPEASPPGPLSVPERGPGGEVPHQVLALNWNPAARVEEFPAVVAAARAAAAAGGPAAPLILQRSLGPDGWRLEGAATQRLLEKLRRAGRPLGDYVGGRFYYGIKTGLNEAFVVDRATRDRLIAEHASSAEVLKPFLRGRDVKRWRVEPQDLWLIFTRRGVNIKAYPAILEHLSQYKTELMPGTPGGRKPGSYEWYEIQDNVAYWQEFEQPKILYQEIATYQAFAWDTVGHYTNNKTFLIPEASLFLLGLLNSASTWFFLGNIATKLQGGAYQMQSPFISQIPIPASSSTAAIEGLVGRILDLTPRPPLPHAGAGEPRSGGGAGLESRSGGGAGGATTIAELEREIDERVYALYGLRPDEIRMIEEQVRGGGAE